MGQGDRTILLSGPDARPKAAGVREDAADVPVAMLVQSVGRGHRGRHLRQLRDAKVHEAEFYDGAGAGRDDATSLPAHVGEMQGRRGDV